MRANLFFYFCHFLAQYALFNGIKYIFSLILAISTKLIHTPYHICNQTSRKGFFIQLLLFHFHGDRYSSLNKENEY